jgi:ketosteroid isomerase-like protein
VRTIALALIGVVVVLAGCGSDDDQPTGTPEQQIRALIGDLNRAVRDRDGDRICNELYTDGLIKRMKAAGLDCVEAINRMSARPSYDVQRVAVDGDRARVEVRATGAGPEAQVILVRREDGRWRIDDAGD